MAGNPRRNALFGVVSETCGLRRLDGGVRSRIRTCLSGDSTLENRGNPLFSAFFSQNGEFKSKGFRFPCVLSVGYAVFGRRILPDADRSRADISLAIPGRTGSSARSQAKTPGAAQGYHHQHFANGQWDKMALNPATKLIGSDVCKLLQHVRLVQYRNGASSFEHLVSKS